MKKYVFIDESGSPQFYAKRKRPLWLDSSFSPIICLGMVSTEDRAALRNSVINFQREVLNDPLFNTIHSVAQPDWYLHARNDHSDIILKMVESLRKMEGFKFSAVIGRKIPDIFIRKHNGSATEFYFDLIHKLLALDDIESGAKHRYSLYLSQRQSNTVQRFSQAFEKALKTKGCESNGIDFSCTIVRSNDCPEMSVVDYLLWALQRYILKGERRYFTALEKHYDKILDVYANEEAGELYNINNRFELSKTGIYTI
jgi:hypothetical protein